MNPHYHPYGGGPELTSPHPPPSPPDNNNYHGGGGGGPPHMHHSNGHGMGPLGHPGGPHDPHSHPHPHVHLQQQHPAFSSSGGGGGGGGPPLHPHHPHHPSQQHHQQHHPHQQQQHPHQQQHPQQQQQHHHQHPMNNNNNNNHMGGGGGTVKVCQGCGGKIMERFLLHALDRYWHNGCLKCSCCGAMLADIGSSCFTKGGMILCKQDYMRLYGNTGACSACGQSIPASELVMRCGGGGGANSTSPTAGGGGPNQPPANNTPHVFHLKCFACSKCGAALVSGDRYYMVAANLVCEQDWHKMLKSSAAAAAAAAAAATGGTGTVRKGKVGRPRRSRD